MKLYIVLWISAIVQGFAIVSSIDANSTKEINEHRLPTSILPNKYTISLVPFYPEFFKFFGTVNISVTALSATSNITLHAQHLNINVSSLNVRNVTSGGYVNITGTELIEDTRQFFIIKLKEELKVNGSYEVYMEYTGEHRDDMYGFYRSSYKVGNETRWLAATQFESTSARRAFPCFDEPAYKAKFQINIAHYKNVTAISNTPLLSTSNEDAQFDNRVWDSFQETVDMSTYLVAFLVSDFKNISSTDKRFRTFARGEVIEHGQYSLFIGSNVLKFYENYTHLPYALEKVDQVALPDFAAGAMENWGLVTYRETALLYDEKNSTEATKQRVASIIAHELAHQWFGNLVTLDWWSFTWLNEGFATYFEYIATNMVEPTWRMLDQFVVEEVQSALAADGLLNTQTLNDECTTPEQIRAKFGTVSYNKGASILHMIKHTVTEEIFKNSIQKYLNDRQFNTAKPEHLYAAFQHHIEQANRTETSVGTIENLFEKWASQPGYPVITVSRNYEQNTAQVLQARFTLVPTLQVLQEKWSVPLTWTRQNSSQKFETTTPMAWIKDSETSITITNIATEDEWVIFNNQETGFYRVNYDIQNWNKIISHMQNGKHQDIHVLNRAQLIDDSLNLAHAGLLNYTTALDVVHYLENETDYIPWYSAFNGFNFLKTVLSGTSSQAFFEAYILHLIQTSYDLLGFKEASNNTHVEILHRGNVLNWACQFGHSDCVAQAKQLFDSWTVTENPDTNNVISPNLRSIVYCTALSNGDTDEWEFMWNRYLNATSASEKMLILSALGCTKNSTLLNGFLNKTITANSGIRKQDAASVFLAVSNNLNATDIVLNFLIHNFVQISQHYGGMNAIMNCIIGVANRLTTEEQVNLLNQFISDNESQLDTIAIVGKLVVESAKGNLQWKKINYITVEKWLKEHTEKVESKASAHYNINIPTIICTLSIIYMLI